MKTVKLFMFRDLPNDAVWDTALELMGKNGLDYGVYEYTVGFYTTGEYKLEDEEEQKPYKEIDDYLVSKGASIDEKVYIKW